MILFSGGPSSKDFDITLMICLLRNLIPIDIMDRLPSATESERIVFIRFRTRLHNSHFPGKVKIHAGKVKS
jgi:hypothetical protein